ncbi:MAG: hypothetical protein JXQ90_12020 [Cyclobacteriaceae bacterium]
MRFPSFIKLPRNKRFTFEARHYDPIKEEIEERTRMIKRQMETGDEDYKPGKIAFERRNIKAPNASLLQLFIAAILGSLVIGWLFYGNAIFQVLWLAVPIYLYFRLRKPKRRAE